MRDAGSPGEAKRRGRTLTLRPEWDETIRFDAMRAVVAAKFAVEPARSRLLDTGDALLIEGTSVGPMWIGRTGNTSDPMRNGR